MSKVIELPKRTQETSEISVEIRMDRFGHEFLFLKFPRGSSYDVHQNIYTSNELINSLLFKLSSIFQKECSDFTTYSKVIAKMQSSILSRKLDLRSDTRDVQGKFIPRVREFMKKDIPVLITLINTNRITL